MSQVRSLPGALTGFAEMDEPYPFDAPAWLSRPIYSFDPCAALTTTANVKVPTYYEMLTAMALTEIEIRTMVLNQVGKPTDIEAFLRATGVDRVSADAKVP